MFQMQNQQQYQSQYQHLYYKLKHRVRKGIPDCYRGYVWYVLGEVQKYMESNKGVYEKFLYEDSFNYETENTIACDIDRTFPSHTFYKDKYGQGQRSLYNVLRAFSKFSPKIGYVQGMGFITAMFLTYMDEESAFWLLHSLMEKYGMDGFYSPEIPDLPKSFYKFLTLMKRFLPKVYEHMTNKQRCVQPSMYASQWFITLFAVNVKSEIRVRILDLFFLEGQKIIYKLGLSILKINEERIINCKHLDEIMNIFKSYDYLDVDEFFHQAFKFQFGKNTLKELDKLYENLIKNKVNHDDEIIEFCK